MVLFHDRTSLAKDFKNLGITAGDTVMVHASIKSVGNVAGGADQILYALEDTISPGGTIMMYVGCETGFDEVGRGRLSTQEETEILEKMPAFDYQTFRADRNFGALAEVFRTQVGTITSNQVGSRMAARGTNAKFLLENHPHNYSYGVGSPLEKLLQLNGKILLLGSDRDAVTFLHYVEHVVEIPDKRVAHYKVPLLVEGKRKWIEMEEFNTAGDGVHKNWTDRFFAEIIDDFLKGTKNFGGRVGNANTFVLRTPDLFSFASQKMKNKAAQGFAL